MNARIALLVAAGFAGGIFVSKVALPGRVAAASTRVYELRTYTTLPGRLEALKARFRDHTTKLFERHGMKNVGYWVPADAPKSENTLIYVLSFESRDAAKKAWDDFRNDPEWKTVQAESEKDGKIVEKVESTFMTPVDFSALQ
jgi:hypothetical protein